MKRTGPALLLAIGLLASVAACNRQSGPSPEFARAHEAFSKLYAQKLDDAYLDPRVAGIEDLLQRVPPRSVDAAEAAALLARIQEGRSRMRKAAEERKAAGQAAIQPVDNLGPSVPTSFELAQAAEAAEDAAVDAGLSQPVGGMSRTEFEKRFGGCFEPGNPVDVQGRGPRDSFHLKDIANCRDRHPGFDNLLVLMEGANVLGTLPKSSLYEAYLDGGRVPADAGGTPVAPVPSPDAGEAVPGADAGAGVY